MKKIAAARVIIFFLISVSILSGIIFTPKQTVSYDENRYLAEFPKLNFDTYKDSEFSKGFENWVSDHFVFRKQFIIIRNNIEKLIGRKEIGGVYTADNMMISLFRADSAVADKNAQYINSFCKNADNVYCLIAPTAQEIYKDKLPGYLNLTSESEYISSFYSKLNNIKTVDIIPELESESDGYLYYRTDHHWTTNGAFIAYNKLSEVMGLSKFDKNDFDVETVSDSFEGTLYSKTLDKSVTPDSIIQYKYKTGENITLEDENGVSDFYKSDKLNEKDKYLFFGGENKGVETVRSSVKNGRKLLLIKDSYANSLIPFLMLNFEEITSLDLRYATASVMKSIDKSSYDEILFLYNCDGFSTETSLSKLMIASES